MRAAACCKSAGLREWLLPLPTERLEESERVEVADRCLMIVVCHCFLGVWYFQGCAEECMSFGRMVCHMFSHAFKCYLCR